MTYLSLKSSPWIVAPYRKTDVKSIASVNGKKAIVKNVMNFGKCLVGVGWVRGGCWMGPGWVLDGAGLGVGWDRGGC